MGEGSSPEVRPDPADGRLTGEWASRYHFSAWLQIVAELAYLLCLLATLSFVTIYIGMSITSADRKAAVIRLALADLSLHRELTQWVIVALSGGVGGIIFDLKWLYHSVAKGLWTRDRVLWRLLVPIISSVVSVFLAFIVVSGLLPFIKNETFRSTYFALGFGFLFGYFSDNVIAALQNFAQKYIGTTKTDDGTNA